MGLGAEEPVELEPVRRGEGPGFEALSSSARRTGEQHRVIHARANRATGARSVGAATREELERGNALLLRELRQ